jgi:hypothetical protein
MAWLSGKKTYIVAIIAGVLNAVQALRPDLLTPATMGVINSVLAALGLAALRAGVEKAA